MNADHLDSAERKVADGSGCFLDRGEILASDGHLHLVTVTLCQDTLRFNVEVRIASEID